VTDSPLHLRRLAALAVLVAAAGLVVASDTLHGRLADAVAWGEGSRARAGRRHGRVRRAVGALGDVRVLPSGLFRRWPGVAPRHLGLLWLGGSAAP
jgi:hypothetical protein